MNGFMSVNVSVDGRTGSRATNGSSVVGPLPLTDWAVEIRQCFAQGMSRTLDLARIVCAAKRNLQHGQWTGLFRTGGLPFSIRKGAMLAVVGAGLEGMNVQTFARLPAGWSVLYYLAQLDRPILEMLVLGETIHPTLTLAEAKALLTKFK